MPTIDRTEPAYVFDFTAHNLQSRDENISVWDPSFGHSSPCNCCLAAVVQTAFRVV